MFGKDGKAKEVNHLVAIGERRDVGRWNTWSSRPLIGQNCIVGKIHTSVTVEISARVSHQLHGNRAFAIDYFFACLPPTPQRRAGYSAQGRAESHSLQNMARSARSTAPSRLTSAAIGHSLILA